MTTEHHATIRAALTFLRRMAAPYGTSVEQVA